MGTEQPKTTAVIVDKLRHDAVDKIDLLFMIDNSMSMGDKQSLLALALPDLVNRLVDPGCVGPDGTPTRPVNGECPDGFVREFRPVDDIHIGVITSSLGGFGAELDCTDADLGQTDAAHLLGSLERVKGESPTTPEFLRWCDPEGDAAKRGTCTPTVETSGGDAEAFSRVFADQVEAAREQGCGWEASLEAWVRFLVDPRPWTRVERQNCPFGDDDDALCVGPALDPETGLPEVDEVLLAQRARFLRPDSLLAIVMLTDENDCSFKPFGQSWRLSQAFRRDEAGRRVHSRAYRSAGICDTAPNDRCCVSCGVATPPEGCPTTMNEAGETVSSGCEEAWYPAASDLGVNDPPSEDPANLRCYDQKRRFGVDYLLPVARYSNALTKTQLCPHADDLDPLAVRSDGSYVCGPNQEFVVPNPLFSDLDHERRLAEDSTAQPVATRDPSLIFLAGIVGVPWQELARDPTASVLQYRTNVPEDAPNVIDWVSLLGDATPGASYDVRAKPPRNPLMWEQIDARPGVDPEVNGGDWNIVNRDDLQYACIFPLNQPVDCPSSSGLEETVPCDCTYYGGDEYENPLCNGLQQTHAKAYPSVRQLQVLRDYGRNSIVASICPKNTTDTGAADFGYRPAIAAIVERLASELAEKCLPRELEVRETEGGSQVSCLIVEADANATGCELAEAREPVSPEVARHVRQRLVNTRLCSDVAGDCLDYQLCSIQPLRPGTEDYQRCLAGDTPQGDGWCYVAPEQGLGDQAQVEKCPATEKRKIRFLGKANPRKGSTTFFACTGAPTL